VSESFDSTSGLVTIRELDPIVRCAPEATFPPTRSSCKEFVSAGVQLERTWQTSSGDRVASMTDSWSSTDGAAHTLDALYEQWFAADSEAGGAFELPGTGGFAPTTKGELVAVPAGAGAIYYKQDAATPDAGDGEHAQGAIVYGTSPSEPLEFHEGTAAGKKTGTQFNMPYRAGVPASGAYALRMGFVQAYALPEVQALSEALESSFALTPSVGAPPHAPFSALAVPPAPPAIRVRQIGPAGGSGGRVTVTLACVGPAGSSCEVQASLSTLELTRSGKLFALSARHGHARTRVQRVSVGSSRVRIAAGRRLRVAIALNATGRGLLARFRRLPVRLRVVLLSGARRSLMISRYLTIHRRLPRRARTDRPRRRRGRR